MSRKPSIFLSYRRASSKDLARYVHSRLTDLGFKVFIDVEELDGKRFARAIRQKIMESDFFLIILKPDTLDENSWVRRELAVALEEEKSIIPLIADGFDFDRHVPPELAGLKDYSGIPYYDHFADEAIERIVKVIKKSQVERRNSLLLLPVAGGVTIVVVVLLLIIVLSAMNAGNTATDTPPTNMHTELAERSNSPTSTSIATSTTTPEPSEAQATIFTSTLTDTPQLPEIPTPTQGDIQSPTNTRLQQTAISMNVQAALDYVVESIRAASTAIATTEVSSTFTEIPTPFIVAFFTDIEPPQGSFILPRFNWTGGMITVTVEVKPPTSPTCEFEWWIYPSTTDRNFSLSPGGGGTINAIAGMTSNGRPLQVMERSLNLPPGEYYFTVFRIGDPDCSFEWRARITQK